MLMSFLLLFEPDFDSLGHKSYFLDWLGESHKKVGNSSLDFYPSSMPKSDKAKYKCLVRAEARLGSVLSRAFGQKSSAWLAIPSKKLGKGCHILQKSSVQLSLLYDLKNRVTLKRQKNELISNIFSNFLKV